MKLATLKGDRQDGRLVVVSRDLTHAVDASAVASTLLDALRTLERGGTASARPRRTARRRTRPEPPSTSIPVSAAAPLPRAPQWCDGSAFLNHGALMQQAFNLPPIADVDTIPLMYHGVSDDLLGPHDDVPLPDETHGIDFEGEFGVIVDDVPMACPSALALRARSSCWCRSTTSSLRSLAPREMRTGFGFFQSKPTSSFAPVAVTPDELGAAWRDARPHLDLKIEYNGRWFGDLDAGEMHFGFDQLRGPCRRDAPADAPGPSSARAPSRIAAARGDRRASPNAVPSRRSSMARP